MANVPIPPGLPSPNQFAPSFKGLDITSRLSSAGCGFLRNPVAIIAVAKSSSSSLPFYVPVPNARVIRRNDYINQSDKFTDNSGILIDCISAVGIGIADYQVQKDNVNFGNGLGVPSSLFTVYGIGLSQPTSKLFIGNITFPCDSGNLITPTASGFGSPSSIPSINLPVPAFNFPGYGIVNPSDLPNGIPLSLFINDQKVFTTNIRENRNTTFNLPSTLLDLMTGKTSFMSNSPMRPGSTLSIYAVATLGNCQKRSQTVNVTLPSLSALPSTQEVCRQLTTRVASINPPSILNPTGSNILTIGGVQQVCALDPTNPKFIKTYGTPDLSGANVGKLSLDTQVITFSIQNGIAQIDLSRLFNVPSLLQKMQTSVPQGAPSLLPPTGAPNPTLPIPTPTQTQTKTGKISSVIEAQLYLPQGYVAEPTTFGGGTAVRITRPNGSYFYAQTYEDINRLLH